MLNHSEEIKSHSRLDCYGRIRRKLSIKGCQCPACDEFFGSDSPFDKHRTGSYENRRCLTVKEMKKIGMAKNEYDYWVVPMDEEKKKKLSEKWK